MTSKERKMLSMAIRKDEFCHKNIKRPKSLSLLIITCPSIALCQVKFSKEKGKMICHIQKMKKVVVVMLRFNQTKEGVEYL